MPHALLRGPEWGMRWAGTPHEQVMPVTEVYVHHTAGADPANSSTKAAAAFKALNESAINSKGYSATDYSMLVHTDQARTTTIGEARGQWTPAATKDRNRQSKAVCLFGYFHPPDLRVGQEWTKKASRQPFPAELEAIAEAIVFMIDQGWVVEAPVIRGHRDNPAHVGATACPGDYLNSELWIVRSLVTTMTGTPLPKPPPMPAPTPVLPDIGDLDMAKVIIDYQRTTPSGVKYSGGSFTLDGIPLDGPVREELLKQGWTAITSGHVFWRTVVGHRNGAAAERMYVDFEDTQDTDKD